MAGVLKLCDQGVCLPVRAQDEMLKNSRANRKPKEMSDA